MTTDEAHRHAAPPGLALAALGVVYGDIGTNPLFALREAFEAHHHVNISEANILGLLSLMFWSLVLVVTVKYLSFVMRADNDGEGGIIALAASAAREPTCTFSATSSRASLCGSPLDRHGLVA